MFSTHTNLFSRLPVLGTGFLFSAATLCAYTNQAGVDINTAIGAEAFYDIGITGQNALVANIEAGHLWIDHDVFSTKGIISLYNGVGGGAAGIPQNHATGVSGVIAGNDGLTNGYRGIAYNASLASGNIAVELSENGGFETTAASLLTTYAWYFGQADVINSSWGSIDSDENGLNNHYDAQDVETSRMIDALAYANRTTTMVVAAGNEGSEGVDISGANTVGSPAVAFNVISVGALNPTLDGVSWFSSRAPSDFFIPPSTEEGEGEYLTRVRATVHILAPGSDLNLAYVDENDPAGSDPAGTDYANGTSFAAPTVAGAVALLSSLSHTEDMGEDSRDARVIKAVLLNSATKLAGWDNGTVVTNGVTAEVDNGSGVETIHADGVQLTTQALDYIQGAGALNLRTALDQYVQENGKGWVLESIGEGGNQTVIVSTEGAQQVELAVTLTWFSKSIIGNLDDIVNEFTDEVDVEYGSLANLNLEVWTLDGDNQFLELVAASRSLYDTVEHLFVTLQLDDVVAGLGLRVVHEGMIFDLLDPEDQVMAEPFALAWSVQAVPEPSTYALMTGVVLLGGVLIRRRRGNG